MLITFADIGNNDCLDNSDEEYCTKPPCLFGTCSQICLEKKAGNYACKYVNIFQAQYCVQYFNLFYDE